MGAAVYEELKFDANGCITNPQLFDYHIPTLKEAPRQTIEFIETPDPIGPFGARGIGEHSVVGVGPAILNAIYDAISVDLFEIPATPDVIKKALAEKAAASKAAALEVA